MKRLLRGLRPVWLAIAALAIAPLVPAQAYAGPTLYVYLPTSVKARALQASLADSMPGVEVTVFGRIRDLEKAMELSQPDALLALRPVLETRGLDVHLQGYRAGAASEPYVAVSAAAFAADGLNEKTVGSIDILGRRHMEGFVSGLLNNASKPSVKRVQEVGDLLPLLQFQVADVVVLSKPAAATLVGSSQLQLTVTDLPEANVGLAALNFGDPADRPAVEAAIKGLPGDTRAKLGIDRWGN